MNKEEETNREYFCPTCGKTMDYVRSEEHKLADKKIMVKLQFWYCLNCSTEWQIDILNNILRKNLIIES